jgi:peptidyl-prolyl cis-trans isomerase A (cyclophilin A)
MKLWNKIAGATLSTILLAACAGPALAQAKQTTPPKTPSKSTAPAKSTTAPSYDKALLNPAALTAKAPDEFGVRFSTTAGDFTVKVTRAWAPNGADHFYNLIKHHFYDGCAFFRVIPGFMAQFGLSPYPDVTKAQEPATIKDDPVKESNKRGFVTYAQTGAPNSRNTQLFINYGDNSRLDKDRFAPFGEVTEGMDVVDKLYGGYGEGAPGGRGPSQDLIGSQGRAYLEKSFPKLDTIKTVTITSPAPAAPAAKTPSKTATKTPAKKSS